MQYTPAPTTSTTRPQHTEAMVQTDEEQDTSTEDANFMDASAFMIETDAEYDPELNPDDDPPNDSESTRSNTSGDQHSGGTDSQHSAHPATT